jgi:hypothetical protein
MQKISFRQLDDLVLELKGLVLVRSLRRENGADANELEMYRARIERVRDRLANIAADESLVYAA